MNIGKNSIFMKKTKVIRFRLHGIFSIITILVLGIAPAHSQYSFINIDATAVIADSAFENEVLASNVVFPDILKGNEEASLDYIEKFSVKRRDYLIRMYTKGKKLLPKAAGILRKYRLPEELKVLMILESAYNGNAVSRAGAVGYWQFMDEVAKEYGLRYVPRQTKEETVVVKKVLRRRGRKITVEKIEKKKTDITFSKEKGKLVDDRKNFNKATVAAAKYLKDRRVNLDDNWLLVVASYNCGVGNVWNAMEKCGKKNPDFWDIKKYLPEETRNYVMNFIALNVIYKNYDKFLKNSLVFKPAKQFTPADIFEENIKEELESNKTASLK